MERLTEKYKFKKLWECFVRQNRHVAGWDEKRTDMDVFIRRTLNKGFSGKYFHLEIDEWNFDRDDYRIYTKYVFIVGIRFHYGRIPSVTVHYLEPHSIIVEEKIMTFNDFLYLKIREAESDFRILQKFYPIRKEMKPNPFKQFTNTNIKNKKK